MVTIAMSLFIASDLHGSVTATEAMLARFEQSGSRYLILLGDILNHGPRNAIPQGYDPTKLAEILNPYADRIIAVRAIVIVKSIKCCWNFHYCNFSAGDSAQMRLFLSHGHIYSPENLPKLLTGDAFVYGHTHIPMAGIKMAFYCSLSPRLPRNHGRPSYGLITETECQVDLETDKILLSCELGIDCKCGMRPKPK